ncbi:MAG: hypothetical protein QF637_13260, partial [Acidimicrobiales bacterium]|nr:hypothetical protein [Acidimicrobiales bacterium]
MGIIENFAKRSFAKKVRKWTGHDLKGDALERALDCLEVIQIASRQFDIPQRNPFVEDSTRMLMHEVEQLGLGSEEGLTLFAREYVRLAAIYG